MGYLIIFLLFSIFTFQQIQEVPSSKQILSLWYRKVIFKVPFQGKAAGLQQVGPGPIRKRNGHTTFRQ